MNEEAIKISEFYDEGYHARGVDRLKFWLMPIAIFVIFGFPSYIGNNIKVLANFVAPAFYILCGFFVLCPGEKKRSAKIKRALNRSFKLFISLFVLYTVIDAVLLYSMGYKITEALTKRMIFDFLVLNRWPVVLPIGASIWFIQSLLYAYIFFFIANEIKLLRFCVPIFIVFYVIMLLTGEFAAVFGFPYFGYEFIPGGAVTRAIPYMLFGMLIRDNAERLLNFHAVIYIFLFVVGIALTCGELELLSKYDILIYYGHMIGLGVMAAAICMLALSDINAKKTFITDHGRSYGTRIYALCQPVYLGITLLLNIVVEQYVGYIIEYRSIIIFVICLVLSYVIGVFKFYGSN
ncbi:MAG: hypothetical protein IKR46_00235 [Clostridia bacterium]|nr:hypothetical protein [Clostridia bacterium]